MSLQPYLPLKLVLLSREDAQLPAPDLQGLVLSITIASFSLRGAMQLLPYVAQRRFRFNAQAKRLTACIV